MTKNDIASTKKCPENFSFLRLDRLRVVTGKTWDKIAEQLGIDTSLIFHVKAGSRTLSTKVLYRLEEAEIAAGIAVPSKMLPEHALRGRQILAGLLGESSPGAIKVSVEEVDKGFTEVHLEYRRGSPPSGYPTKMQVRTPGNAIIWQVIGKSGVLEDPIPLLFACLPEKYSRTEFVDRLTPRCYRRLVEVAMTLTFGIHWKNPEKS